MLTKFFFSWFLPWLPVFFSGTILLIAILKYFSYFKKISWTKLTYILISGTILFDLSLSIIQYLVWQGAAFTLLFLPPYQSIGYFVHYVTFHFWLANILVLISALAFFLILKLIKKYRDGVISQDELALILLMGLLSGWPKFVLFIPLFLVLSLLFSFINLAILKQNKTALFWPIIISALVVFCLGNYLIKILALSVLII